MKNTSKAIRLAAVAVLTMLSLAGAAEATTVPGAIAKPANGHVWCC